MLIDTQNVFDRDLSFDFVFQQDLPFALFIFPYNNKFSYQPDIKTCSI